MSKATCAEPEIDNLSSDDPWGICRNEVNSINDLIQWLMKYPHPAPIVQLGRVAEGIQQVVLGAHYNAKELTRAGVNEIKSAAETIQATYGEWTVADCEDYGCGCDHKWLWLQKILQWFHDHHERGSIIPSPPWGPGPLWYRQLAEIMVGMQEILLLGGVEDPEVRQTIASTVFDRLNASVEKMRGMTM